MPIDTWIWFIISSTALLLIPGPTILLVVFYAINQGRKVAMALGMALGDFVAITASCWDWACWCWRQPHYLRS